MPKRTHEGPLKGGAWWLGANEHTKPQGPAAARERQALQRSHQLTTNGRTKEGSIKGTGRKEGRKPPQPNTAKAKAQPNPLSSFGRSSFGRSVVRSFGRSVVRRSSVFITVVVDALFAAVAAEFPVEPSSSCVAMAMLLSTVIAIPCGCFRTATRVVFALAIPLCISATFLRCALCISHEWVPDVTE